MAVQNTVLLTVGGPSWWWGSNYILSVTGVSDTRGNRLNGLSNRVAVAFMKQVFPMNGVSKHFDWVEALFFQPTNLTGFEATWMRPEADHSSIHWINVRGVAFYELRALGNFCGPLGDVLGDVANDLSWPTTYYFRTRFELPPYNGRGAIQLRAAIDDGAVFYLNGVEIYRFNMPAAPVDRYTAAIADIDPVTCIQTPLIDVTNLLSGTNVLATEVHQSTDRNSLDLFFGVEIGVLCPPPACAAVRIERTDSVPDGIVVTWPATEFPGWGLLAQTPGTANWTLVATHSPFRTNLVSGAAQFYRLGVPGVPP